MSLKEIFSSNDPGEIAFLQSIFQDAGIQIFLFDQHTNSIAGGFAGGFAPCRIMVSESDFETALDLLDDLDEQLAAEDEENDDDDSQ
jgi:hypothetical protein